MPSCQCAPIRTAARSHQSICQHVYAHGSGLYGSAEKLEETETIQIEEDVVKQPIGDWLSLHEKKKKSTATASRGQIPWSCLIPWFATTVRMHVHLHIGTYVCGLEEEKKEKDV